MHILMKTFDPAFFWTFSNQNENLDGKFKTFHIFGYRPKVFSSEPGNPVFLCVSYGFLHFPFGFSMGFPWISRMMHVVLQLLPRDTQLLLHLRRVQHLRGLPLPGLELLEEGADRRIEGARQWRHGAFGPGNMWKCRENGCENLKCWVLLVKSAKRNNDPFCSFEYPRKANKQTNMRMSVWL